MPAGTASLRLLADQTATVLAGFAVVLDGLRLLAADPSRRHSRRRRFYVADWLPALVNGGRALVTIGAVQIFWIMTAWPHGALATTFAAIVVILLAPRADEAYAGAISFMVGAGAAAVCTAIILFAVLPNVATFAGFSAVLAIYLLPVGALITQPWNTAAFTAMASNFVPLLAPANRMNYDIVQFYNAALAIVAGCGAAALSFRLLPPLSPAYRARRLLALTLRDLRRLARSASGGLVNDWEDRVHGRLLALPDAAEPLQRGRLLAALSVGSEITHLRRIVPELGLCSQLDPALDGFARGDCLTAIILLERLDRSLAALAAPEARSCAAQRERARILLVCDALVQHRAYFEEATAL
jgi:uncharacterized membrane protein YccC